MQACRNREGFTLVELMVSAAILLLTMGALLLAFVQVKRGSTSAEYRMAALHLAREDLERLRAAPYTNLAALGPVSLSNGLLARVRGQLQRSVADSNSFKTVSVAIRWIPAASRGWIGLTQETIVARMD